MYKFFLFVYSINKWQENLQRKVQDDLLQDDQVQDDLLQNDQAQDDQDDQVQDDQVQGVQRYVRIIEPLKRHV